MSIKLYPKIKKAFTVVGMMLATNAAMAQYCTPSAGTLGNCYIGSVSTTTYARINNVKTTGAVTNISNPNNTCNNATGYTYYTTGGVVNAGSTVACTVDVHNHGQSSYPYRVVVWVDWNRDGTFDNTVYNATTNPTGEVMYVSTATLAYQATFNMPIPLSAKNGMSRMRVRAGTRNGTLPIAIPTNYDPCTASSFIWGEVEDYDLMVLNPCTAPSALPPTNLTYKSATINWNKKLIAVLYEYTISKTNIPPTSYGYYLTTNTFVQLPDTNLPSIECDTKYYYWVRSICDTVGKEQLNWEYSPWRLDSFTTPPCCYTPEVTINYITSTTAIASWNPVQSVIDYEYAVSADTVTPPSGTITTQTSVLLQGLPPGREVYFFLRARCSPTPLSEWGLDSFLTQPGTGVEVMNEVSDFTIKAFPNPAKDNVHIRVTDGIKLGVGNIEIVDLSGRVMATERMDANTKDISIANLPSGVYILKYTDDKHSKIIKLNKE